MIDMKWSPLVGATLVDRKTWEQIEPKLRAEPLTITRKAGNDFRAQIRTAGDDAVEQMVLRHGLKVATLTDAEKALWRREVEAAYPRMRGKLVAPDLFDEAVRLSKEYRPSR